MVEKRSFGGRQPGAGRKPGVPNKVKRELAEAARRYTPEALLTAVKAMRRLQRIVAGKDDQLAISASSALVQVLNVLFDRGHGKPTQALKHSGGGDRDDAPIPIHLASLSNAQLEQLLERLNASEG
jgi:hypothetical protein